ncbi:MAG: cadherin-like beta sandwich domain-containing protein [Bacteroidales bacterium]|nr:cadherin-like beta sandwich domain-containing protein [Bacteroidales bacterium]
MKKNLLFMFVMLTGFTFLSAQTVVFGDDFESYADDASLADHGYVLWEGGAVVSDITIDGGTAVSGSKFAVCQPSGNSFYFRKTVAVEEGKNYTFEAMTKSPGAKNHRIGYVLGSDAAVQAPLIGATEWTKSTLSFTPAAGQTSVVLFVFSWPISNVHVDDFILTVEGSSVTATLSDLTIDVGTLVPVFDENTFDYTATLPAGTTVTPTITATAAEAGSTVDVVDAADLTSATEADRTSTVTVTGEDGTTINVYSIVFDVAASNDATLSDLTLSEGTLDPAFVAATTAYTAVLPYGTAAAPTVTATPTNANATVAVTDATDVTSAIEADRTTTVVVTAEDGTTTATYTIVFSIAPNSDATLSALTLSEGTLVPDFDAATTAYTAALPAGTTATPAVTATAADANAGVVVTDAADVTSAAEADRTTTIVVTAEDGTTTKTYSIVFSVIDDTPYAYLPVFADDFEGYENAFNLADTGYVLWEGGATVVDVDAEGGKAANSGTKYAHLSPSANNFYFRRPLELEEGTDYVFELFTKSPGSKNHRAVAKIGDRTIQGPLVSDTVWTKTSLEFTVGTGEASAIFWVYSYPVSRVDLDDFGIYKKVDASGTLSALSIDGVSLDPEFDLFTFNYAAELAAGTSTAPTVTATAFEDDATVSITDATDVTSTNEADRTTTIEVVSGDGATTNTYTIVFDVVVSVTETMTSRFSLYPNPATDHLIIGNAEAIRSVSIVTVSGQEIRRQAATGDANLRLDVADLDPGVYVISIVDKDQHRYAGRIVRK